MSALSLIIIILGIFGVIIGSYSLVVRYNRKILSRLDLQLELLKDLAAYDQLEMVYNRSLSYLGSHLNWDNGRVWVYDSKFEVLRNEYSWQCELMDTPKLPSSWGPGRVLKESKMIFEPKCLWIPIWYHRQLAAVIEFGSDHATHTITPELETLLELISGNVGLTVSRILNQKTIVEQNLKIFEASRMSAVGEMASKISHEINNPLTVIVTRTAQIRMVAQGEESIDRNELVEISKKIDATIARIVKIIKSVKTLSRDATQDPFQRAKISLIFEDALEVCRDRLKQMGIALDTSEVVDFEFYCRSTQVSQVLLNLINNARDAIENLPGEKWIKLSSKIEEDRAIIAVTDSGNGIPQNILKKIFEPFFTTKGVVKGTGLGLGISKSICESHGGTLVYNELSPHTRFEIRLPMIQSKPVSNPTTSEAA